MADPPRVVAQHQPVLDLGQILLEARENHRQWKGLHRRVAGGGTPQLVAAALTPLGLAANRPDGHQQPQGSVVVSHTGVALRRPPAVAYGAPRCYRERRTSPPPVVSNTTSSRRHGAGTSRPSYTSDPLTAERRPATARVPMRPPPEGAQSPPAPQRRSRYSPKSMPSNQKSSSSPNRMRPSSQKGQKGETGSPIPSGSLVVDTSGSVAGALDLGTPGLQQRIRDALNQLADDPTGPAARSFDRYCKHVRQSRSPPRRDATIFAKVGRYESRHAARAAHAAAVRSQRTAKELQRIARQEAALARSEQRHDRGRTRAQRWAVVVTQASAMTALLHAVPHVVEAAARARRGDPGEWQCPWPTFGDDNEEGAEAFPGETTLTTQVPPPPGGCRTLHRLVVVAQSAGVFISLLRLVRRRVNAVRILKTYLSEWRLRTPVYNYLRNFTHHVRRLQLSFAQSLFASRSRVLWGVMQLTAVQSNTHAAAQRVAPESLRLLAAQYTRQPPVELCSALVTTLAQHLPLFFLYKQRAASARFAAYSAEVSDAIMDYTRQRRRLRKLVVLHGGDRVQAVGMLQRAEGRALLERPWVPRWILARELQQVHDSARRSMLADLHEVALRQWTALAGEHADPTAPATPGIVPAPYDFCVLFAGYVYGMLQESRAQERRFVHSMCLATHYPPHEEEVEQCRSIPPSSSVNVSPRPPTAAAALRSRPLPLSLLRRRPSMAAGLVLPGEARVIENTASSPLVSNADKETLAIVARSWFGQRGGELSAELKQLVLIQELHKSMARSSNRRASIRAVAMAATTAADAPTTSAKSRTSVSFHHVRPPPQAVLSCDDDPFDQSTSIRRSQADRRMTTSAAQQRGSVALSAVSVNSTSTAPEDLNASEGQHLSVVLRLYFDRSPFVFL